MEQAPADRGIATEAHGQTSPRYFIQTFGCQMNVHDSRRIAEVLHDAGWVPAQSPEQARLVLVNTCSVREKAEHKLMSYAGRLRQRKEAEPGLLIVVAGCVAQQEGQRLLRKAPTIDLVLGPDRIVELPSLLEALLDGAPPMTRTGFDHHAPNFLHARPRAGEAQAYVTVMKGCDERCSFCIVPTTRGAERYRPAGDILSEIEGLVAGGVREITLLGQTVNSWYDPAVGKSGRRDPSRFSWLLGRIAERAPQLERLRYTSPHPRHVTLDLLAAHRELQILCPHVHLPVQSGSNRVLRRMLRRYTRDEYLAAAQALRNTRAGTTLSTDLIVGFPGETEADFRQTLDLVRQAGFVAGFAFKYSPRPGTAALRLDGEVAEEVKEERLARLLELLGQQQRLHLENLVGSRTRVLVEGLSPLDRPGGSETGSPADRQRDTAPMARWHGRSERFEIVHFEAPRDMALAGALLDIKLLAANRHSLHGEVLPGELTRWGECKGIPADDRAPPHRIVPSFATQRRRSLTVLPEQSVP